MTHTTTNVKCSAALPIDRERQRFHDREYRCLEEVLVDPRHKTELEDGLWEKIETIHGQRVKVTVYPAAWASGALLLQGFVYVRGWE